MFMASLLLLILSKASLLLLLLFYPCCCCIPAVADFPSCPDVITKASPLVVLAPWRSCRLEILPLLTFMLLLASMLLLMFLLLLLPSFAAVSTNHVCLP
jgi:hypothetical protein